MAAQLILLCVPIGRCAASSPACFSFRLKSLAACLALVYLASDKMNVMPAAAEALSLQHYIYPVLVIKAATKITTIQMSQPSFLFFHSQFFPNSGIVTFEVGCFASERCLSPRTASRFGSLSLRLFSSKRRRSHTGSTQTVCHPQSLELLGELQAARWHQTPGALLNQSFCSLERPPPKKQARLDPRYLYVTTLPGRCQEW